MRAWSPQLTLVEADSTFTRLKMSARRIVVTQVDPCSPPPLALIKELDRHLSQLYPAESNYLMDLDALCARDVRFFAAHVDGETLGCGAIKQFADYTEVKRLYVSPRARGLGMAKLVIKALETATRDAGLRIMRLETGIYQPDALALFEKVGFMRISNFGDYPKDDPYSVFMERKLP
jgi:putative acetyltransferase